jgi:hypothetical protein
VRRPQIGLRRRAGRIGGLAVALVVVRLGIGVAGPIAMAAVLALAATLVAVGWWARVVEPRLFAPRHPPATAVGRTRRSAPTSEERHLAFARALVTVADRYLAECEASGQE